MKKLFLLTLLSMISWMGFAEPVTDLYMIGPAFFDLTDGGWNNKTAIQMESKGNGVFTWTGVMKANAQFKFMLQKGAWGNSYVSTVKQDEPVVLGTAHPITFLPSGDALDFKFNTKALKGTFKITVDTENLTMVLDRPESIFPTQNVISVSSADGKGKRMVNIYACSGSTGDTENPYKLLLGIDKISGTGDKWCVNQDSPWVIFSLSGIYAIDGFGFRDGHFYETDGYNLGGHKVYVSTTGIEDADWTEVLNETTDQSMCEKFTSFAPQEARYIKFVPVLKDPANKYIRIYNACITGTYLRPIDPAIVSTGKAIVDYDKPTSGRETPANIIDGNIIPVANAKYANNPWAFSKTASWVVIDLESSYSISKFALTTIFEDADPTAYIDGYKVSVSDSPEGPWTVAYDGTAAGTFEAATDRKEAVLATAVKGRYIKLEVPEENQFGWTRIREFEVYKGEELPTRINTIKDSSEKLTVYPNPIAKGENIQLNASGMLKIYSLQGILVYQQNISGIALIPTTDFAQGSYIVRLTSESGTKQTKLIVR